MQVAKRRKLVVRLGEVYFAPRIDPDEPQAADCDLLSFVHASAPIAGATPVRTLLLNLRQSDEDLLRQMSKSTRYKIRRARDQDGFSARVMIEPTMEEVREFAGFYARFAETKAMRSGKLEPLTRLNEAGGLVLANLTDRSQTTLCWDSYVVDGERAMRHYFAYDVDRFSASWQRTLVGRASRYLVWETMRGLRDAGYRVLDLDTLAGPVGSTPLPGMDSYKRGFGGSEAVEHDYRHARTPLGKVALVYWHVVDRLVAMRRGEQDPVLDDVQPRRRQRCGAVEEGLGGAVSGSRSHRP